MVIKNCVTQTRMWLKWGDYKKVYYNELQCNSSYIFFIYDELMVKNKFQKPLREREFGRQQDSN